MPNPNARVPLDNFVQNGDITLQQLLNNVANVNSGTKPNVVEQVRDPATGRLVEVVLSLPESVAEQAVVAINNTPGVPTTVTAIPRRLSLSDVTNMAGVGLSGGFGAPSVVEVLNDDGLLLGTLEVVGSNDNTYVDGAETVQASPIKIRLYGN